jgi:hypothetical protein
MAIPERVARISGIMAQTPQRQPGILPGAVLGDRAMWQFSQTVGFFVGFAHGRPRAAVSLQGCKKDFTITSGTLFASHKLPLKAYLAAIAGHPSRCVKQRTRPADARCQEINCSGRLGVCTGT